MRGLLIAVFFISTICFATSSHRFDKSKLYSTKAGCMACHQLSQPEKKKNHRIKLLKKRAEK